MESKPLEVLLRWDTADRKQTNSFPSCQLCLVISRWMIWKLKASSGFCRARAFDYGDWAQTGAEGQKFFKGAIRWVRYSGLSFYTGTWMALVAVEYEVFFCCKAWWSTRPFYVGWDDCSFVILSLFCIEPWIAPKALLYFPQTFFIVNYFNEN